MTLEAYPKPIPGLWRARYYFGLGAILYFLNTVFGYFYEKLPSIVDPGFLESIAPITTLIAKMFSSLEKVGSLIFVAGIAHAVLSELIDYLWTGKLQMEVKKGFEGIQTAVAIGVSDITPEVVQRAIEHGNYKSDSQKSIG